MQPTSEIAFMFQLRRLACQVGEDLLHGVLRQVFIPVQLTSSGCIDQATKLLHQALEGLVGTVGHVSGQDVLDIVFGHTPYSIRRSENPTDFLWVNMITVTGFIQAPVGVPIVAGG